ncbi:MAG: helix-turn-helix transcriptional regulator [Ktedonobacterales bacterium]
MRADRLLSLLLLLENRGRMTASELAQRLEVSERTIYRDITALGTAGIPVYAERGPGGGCRLVEGYHTDLTGFTEEEVRTLFLSGAPGLLNDLGLSTALEVAALKLIAALPAAYRQRVQQARQRIHVDPVSWSPYDEAVPNLAALQQAVLEEKRLRLLYRKGNGEVVERIVDPLGLVAKATVWYLVCRYIDPAGQLRVFRVSRVLEVMFQGEASERPIDFDLAEYWQSWSREFSAMLPQYEVRVRIEPPAVPVVVSILGDGMARRIEGATKEKDGAIYVSLTYDSLEHARSRLLSVGTLLEVVEPPELRESIMDCASRIISFYSRSTPAGSTPAGAGVPRSRDRENGN